MSDDIRTAYRRIRQHMRDMVSLPGEPRPFIRGHIDGLDYAVKVLEQEMTIFPEEWPSKSHMSEAEFRREFMNEPRG